MNNKLMVFLSSLCVIAIGCGREMEESNTANEQTDAVSEPVKVQIMVKDQREAALPAVEQAPVVPTEVGTETTEIAPIAGGFGAPGLCADPAAPGCQGLGLPLGGGAPFVTPGVPFDPALGYPGFGPFPYYYPVLIESRFDNDDDDHHRRNKRHHRRDRDRDEDGEDGEDGDDNEDM